MNIQFERKVTSKNINIFQDLNEYHYVWKMMDLAESFFLLFSILLITADYEFSFNPDRSYDNCLEFNSNENLKLGSVILTLIAIICCILKYKYKSHWLVILYKIETPISNKEKLRRDSKRKRRLMIEILILLIMPYPHFVFSIFAPFRHDFKTLISCYNVSEILYCLMFVRMHFILRAVTNFNIYRNSISRRACKKYKVKSDLFFTLKCLLVTHPGSVILSIGFFTVFFTTIACRIFERPLDKYSGQYYGNPLDAVWFIFETFSTLGYGEYIPVTYYARFFALIAWLLGSVVIGIVISVLQNGMEISSNEMQVFEAMKSLNQAKLVMKAGLLYIITKKRKGWKSKETLNFYKDLVSAVEKFKVVREEKGSKVEYKSGIIIKACQDIDSMKGMLKDCSVTLDTLIKEYNMNVNSFG